MGGTSNTHGPSVLTDRINLVAGAHLVPTALNATSNGQGIIGRNAVFPLGSGATRNVMFRSISMAGNSHMTTIVITNHMCTGHLPTRPDTSSDSGANTGSALRGDNIIFIGTPRAAETWEDGGL